MGSRSGSLSLTLTFTSRKRHATLGLTCLSLSLQSPHASFFLSLWNLFITRRNFREPLQLVKARPFLFLSIIYLYSISNLFSFFCSLSVWANPYLSVALRRRRFPPFTNAYVCVTFISVCVMYISASSSSSSALSSILRARSRLFASSPYLSRTFAA